MNNSGVKNQDTAVFGKTMQTLLLAAFTPDNFEPFLKKIIEILSGPGGLGRKSMIAIALNGPGGRPLALFRNAPAAERRLILAGLKKSARSCRKSLLFLTDIKHGGARAGRITARLQKTPQSPEAATRLIETAARIIEARLSGEKRDSDLGFTRDLISAVKHVEELYLSFPNISIEEISRAVLDEARRLTGSAFGFAGYIDPATGWLRVPSFTHDAMKGPAAQAQPIIFKEYSGLWGWTLKRKKALLTNNAKEDKRAVPLPQEHVKIEKFLGVPAMSGRKLLGMLALANPPGDYGPAALETAQKLARVYAMILQRKLAEDRQRSEDTRFKTIISSSKDIIYTAGLDGRITYMSTRAEDYGYVPAELIGHFVSEFAHPEDREFVTKAFTNAVKTGQTLPILPYRIKKKDGSFLYAEQKSGIVFENGKPAYITGVIRDVTEQRKTETRLKENEALMGMVFDTASDSIFIKDMNGMYLTVNKAFAGLFNKTTEEMLGKSDIDLFSPEIAASAFKEDSEVVRSGKTLAFTRGRTLPAGEYYLNTIKTPVRNLQGEIVGLMGIARDITALKRMETELALARAAEAVSNVARPIAHDFNNALAAINGYATLIDDDLGADSPIKTEISRIIEAVKRAAVLTSKFQDFARDPKIKNPGETGGWSEATQFNKDRKKNGN
jgi:PAS domain S-box-containing protein